MVVIVVLAQTATLRNMTIVTTAPAWILLHQNLDPPPLIHQILSQPPPLKEDQQESVNFHPGRETACATMIATMLHATGMVVIVVLAQTATLRFMPIVGTAPVWILTHLKTQDQQESVNFHPGRETGCATMKPTMLHATGMVVIVVLAQTATLRNMTIATTAPAWILLPQNLDPPPLELVELNRH